MLFDMHGDPIQPITMASSLGVSRIQGPVLGIVLSVNYADAANNMWVQLLSGSSTVEDPNRRAAYLEANVLVISGGSLMSLEIPHCIITQAKCSRVGPSEDEPAHWSEDVPQGCKPEELDTFYASGGEVGIENLSGDWVIVDFIGGLLQLPIITRWFPNPFNVSDSAGKEDGQRWRIRRNNTDLKIDKDGNFSVAHRRGNYLQIHGKKITLKHISGTVINIDDEGNIILSNDKGYNATITADGIQFTTGKATLDVRSDGKVMVTAPESDITVAGQNIDLIGSVVNASAGQMGGNALAKERVLDTLRVLIDAVSFVFTSPVAAIMDPSGTSVAAYTALLTTEQQSMTNSLEEFMTSVLRGE